MVLSAREQSSYERCRAAQAPFMFQCLLFERSKMHAVNGQAGGNLHKWLLSFEHGKPVPIRP